MKDKAKSWFYRYYKYIIAAFAIIILTLGAVGWYFQRHYSSILSQKLKNLVIRSTDSLYRIDFTSLNINLLTGSISLDSLQLIPDTLVYNQLKEIKQAPGNLFNVSMKTLELHHAHPLSLIFNKRVRIKAINSENPIVKIHHEEFSNSDTAKTIQTSLADLLSGSLNAIKIKNINLNNIALFYTNNSKRASGTFKLKHLDVVIKKLNIDSSTLKDTTRYLFAKDIRFHLKDYNFPTPDSLYFVKVEDFVFSTKQGDGIIQGLTLEPRLNKKEFDSRLKYRKSHYDITIDTILLKKINSINVKKSIWHIGAISMKRAQINIYLNRSFPLAPKEKLLPQQMLKNTEFSFILDTLKFHGVNIKYSELNPKSGRIGSVIFQQTHGNFYNITNDSSAIEKDNHTTADLETLFMGEGKTKVHFDFNLEAPDESFLFSGHLENMKAKKLNPATKPLGLIDINSGRIHKLNFNFSANVSKARGSVQLLYDRLKVKVLSTNRDNELKKKGLISLMANLLLVKNENINDPDAIKTTKVVYERDSQRSVFTFMWKSLFEGVKNIVLGKETQEVIKDLKKSDKEGKKLKFRHQMI